MENWLLAVVARSPLLWSMYVWLLGPEARREVARLARAMIAMREANDGLGTR